MWVGIIIADVWVVGGVSVQQGKETSRLAFALGVVHLAHSTPERRRRIEGPICSTLITASNGTRAAARFSLEPHHEQGVGH